MSKARVAAAVAALALGVAPGSASAVSPGCSVTLVNTAVGASVAQTCQGTFSFAGACHYARNGTAVAYGGSLTTSGTATQVPELTYVHCEVKTATGSAIAQLAAGGPVVAIAAAAFLPTGATTICISGFGVFGPLPTVVVTFPRACY